MLPVEIFEKKKKITFNSFSGEAETERRRNFADF
jgi:hypothetical protein